MIRILIVEDQAILRESLARSVGDQPDMTVVAAIADASDALDVALKEHPDMILMDVCTEHDSNGIVAAARIKEQLPECRIVIMTGMPEITFVDQAREAGVDEFKAELLPEDKYAYVEQIKREGRRVAMVGDGVNDSPALGLADVGLAMGGGSDIAKEVADIILADTDLAAIVRLRRMSQGLIDRLTSSYSKVMLTNSALLALGITGAITPQASSLLHNGSTIAYSLGNAKAYLR